MGNQLRYNNHYFYKQNTSVFEDIINEIQDNALDIKAIEDGYLLGAVNQNNELNQNDSLILSIPFDENWDVYVNDELVQQEKVFDRITLIKLPEQNDMIIEMVYVPKGLKLSIIINIIAILITIMLFKENIRKNLMMKK